MKPARFEYSRPANLDEACAMLAQGDEVRLIAGGQTLVPLMAMRLARPKRLIDIARLTELAFVRREGDAVAIGATTKQCVLEHDPVLRSEVPLLAKVMPFVGHSPVRARGTLGGSLANADPAAEIALVAVTLGATIVYRDGNQLIEVSAAELFTGPMTTVLPPSGCLTLARFPVWREARLGVGFHEINARRSDFAFGSAAAQIALAEDGTCARLALGIGAVTAVPRRLDALGEMLKGKRLEEKDLRAAIAAALADIDPLSDLHASAEYRRRAAATLLLRAITDAYADARGQPPPGLPKTGHASDIESPSPRPLAVLAPTLSPPRRGEGAEPRSGEAGEGHHEGSSNPIVSRTAALSTRVELTINSATHTLDIDPRMSLLDCLRDRLLLTGSHAGCEHGVCGACTVLLDGVPVRSCLMFAVQADGYAITTIEGIAPGPGELSLIQDAFCETHAMQCGYCTPAMILTAHALLDGNPAPSRAEIVEAISANICRCTGYAQIIEAVALAAERMRGLNAPMAAT